MSDRFNVGAAVLSLTAFFNEGCWLCFVGSRGFKRAVVESVSVQVAE
jgi:hypothetical protein